MKKALVIVDYQVDFVSGSLGFDGAKLLDERIAKRIDEVRKDPSWDVIFTFDTHHEQYAHTQEGRKLPIKHCIDQSDGWQLYGAVGKRFSRTDAFFKKPTFGSFELAQYLRHHQYAEVELCGLVSYICVISNAVLAKSALPEARIVIKKDLTDGPDKHLVAAASQVMMALQIDLV